jgi:hypothetical protein
MAKDETEIGITGKPIPKKKRSPKKQYKFEKDRRENLGQNVGGKTYRSDVSPNFNPRSVREEVLVDYLLDEGFASDEKSAQAIAGAMSEAWVESIVEASEEDKERLRNYEVRYYQKHGGMPPDPEKRRQLRDAARRLPPA